MSKGFDRLARIYDPMARIVFGRSIVRAQTCMLRELPADATVLVVGGGTGWYLEALLREAQPKSVHYLERSRNMLERSRARIARRLPASQASVTYVEGGLEALDPKLRFDVICTHFLLDVYEGEALQALVRDLRSRLRPGGHWSLADFRIPRSWPMSWYAGALVWIMYRFFRLTTGIPARRLSDFAQILQNNGLIPHSGPKRFYGGMIFSALFRKSD